MPKKGCRLHLIKCEECRRDKQKCLPITRKWPEKCERCTQKGFQCSEGKRAAWKRRRLLDRRGDVRAEREAEASPEQDSDNEEEDLNTWAFLLSVHQIMTKALKQLHKIRKETCILFDISQPDLNRTRYETGSKIEDFERFVQELGKVLLAMSKNALDSKTNNTSVDVMHSLVGNFLNDDYSTTSASPCLICDVDDDALEMLQDQNSCAAEYLTRIARWAHHCRHIDYRPADHHVAQEWETIERLTDKVKAKTIHVLRGLDFVEKIPEVPLFMPEEVSLSPEVRASLLPQDCLERTWLHQLLDMDFISIDRGVDQFILDALDSIQSKNFQYQSHFYQSRFWDKKDIIGRTALHIACQKNYEKVVSALRRLGADVGVTAIFGSLPLHYAASTGSDAICQQLQLSPKASINAVDSFGMTALYYAFAHRKRSVVELLLLDPDIRPNEWAPENQPSILSRSIAKQDLGLVKMVLDRGVDPSRLHRKALNEMPPVYVAIHQKHIRMLRLLCEQCTDINMLDATDSTPILYASYRNFVEGVKYLKNCEEVDINSMNKYGDTALTIAARFGHLEVVKALIEAEEIDIGIKNPRTGLTAANIARKYGHLDVADLLDGFEELAVLL
ncbi:ankyrin [Aaosphaeria arxii CBS 175.79]|uniref:Ankyrin n=1 Tax=Aaosphaeria arxii CBS 175.79 TaxID=1450172 RepID=A0A6A5XS25_9PLEO|nr:ankyrin [Aaosphaeria arxii CBS 175.79]KAF2015561.1 ankyrin [Aaosphaeria arxii CBS 175.79]